MGCRGVTTLKSPKSWLRGGRLIPEREGTLGRSFLEEVALGVGGWGGLVDGWMWVFLKAG